jgi:uncharacterized protein
MTPTLGTLPIDLPRLLETRLLVQANSGGGKSWALRRLLEQTAGQVQQLVIDPEGEFATLRERFDYIVCAPQGADAVATPQTAAALARALWKAGTSAILDIYELKAHERILFVRRFLEALVNAPRALWHPTLVVIDEVHTFCPQVGSAESASAVIDLATRGRKRGLALVGATQRLSKLHKDAAAELLNKLIGRTGLDVDVQRAADELGMSRKEATDALRNLRPGEFFAHRHRDHHRRSRHDAPADRPPRADRSASAFGQGAGGAGQAGGSAARGRGRGAHRRRPARRGDDAEAQADDRREGGADHSHRAQRG